ncbi:hypothetical protein CRG98_014548 [Punica granatum]|uniref:CCHC-type domain-containing protein n=1 Tax=Punica granatum TaxID=22663 RepID=A0A2I0K966_PUNGR|nr:hypothetical protein CRG98_014548 [Punica granatum]
MAGSDDCNPGLEWLEEGRDGNKPEKMEQSKWDELHERALSALQLCLMNNALEELSYKTFRETLIYGRDNLTFEDVKGSLLSKDKLDNKLGSSSRPDEQASGLVARGRQQSTGLGQNRLRSKLRNKDKFCRYCKKKGHFVAECYKLKNKLRKGVCRSRQLSVLSGEPVTTLVLGAEDSGRVTVRAVSGESPRDWMRSKTVGQSSLGWTKWNLRGTNGSNGGAGRGEMLGIVELELELRQKKPLSQ